MHFDTYITYLISGTLLLMVALITTFKRKGDDQKANAYLAAYFWCYALSVFIAFAVMHGFTRLWPHLYRSAQIPALLIMPLSYLYVSRKLHGKQLRTIDLLHLLPAAIYLVDYAPFLMLSADKKLALYLAEAAHPVRLKLAYAEGWFMPDYGHTILRYAVWFGYWIAQVSILVKARRFAGPDQTRMEPKNWHWLQLLVASQALIFMPPLLAALVGSEAAIGQWINVAAMMASVVQCYYLLFRPEVLYSMGAGVQHAGQDASTRPNEEPLAIPEQQTYLQQEALAEGDLDEASLSTSFRYQLTEEALDEVEKSLAALMAVQQPYLKARYSIRDLAIDSGVVTHRISAYLNRRCGQNFFGYINAFRIQHCLNRLEKGDHQAMTLEALAQECGFQSRATFIRAFKTHTGKTPSEYISNTSHSVSNW